MNPLIQLDQRRRPTTLAKHGPVVSQPSAHSVAVESHWVGHQFDHPTAPAIMPGTIGPMIRVSVE
jgi:hypothetical protein